MRDTRSPVEISAELERLVYELMDAHADTAQLAQGLTADLRWRAHLDYLQALQRVGREMLASDEPV